MKGAFTLIITKMKKEGLFGMDNKKVLFFLFSYIATDTITSLQYYFIQKDQIKDESRSENSES